MSNVLEDLISNTRGYLLIQVRRHGRDQTPEFQSYLHSLEEKHKGNLRVVQLTWFGYGEWIKKFEMYGAPGFIMFHNGAVCLKIHGRVNIETLDRILNDRVFKDPASTSEQ